MIKKKLLSLTVFMTITATIMMGCSGAGKVNENKETTEAIEQSEEIISEEEQNKIYSELFDINNKVTVKIDMSETEIAKMEADFKTYYKKRSKSPIYRKADKVIITIGDDTYEINDVGVRMKGNLSRTTFYNPVNGIHNMIHLRLSFDETFDDESYYGNEAEKWTDDKAREQRKKRTFASLDGLEIKWNRNYDNAYVRQRYSYEMFRNFGVPAPQSSFANLRLGDENYGVFFIGEPVDKKFIERYIDEEEQGGDLYKGGWTNTPANYTLNMTYGVADKDEGDFYNMELKTNKSTSEHKNMENLLDMLNSNDTTKEDFEKYVDVDEVMKFMAVSYFLGNPDDLRNNYNNHYIYFNKSTGKAILIPYDYDRTLGVTYSYNPEATGMTEVSPFSESAEATGQKQNNPLYRKSILENGFFRSEYKDALKEIAGSDWMDPERIEAEYEIVKKNYEDVAVIDKKMDNVQNDKLGFSLEGEFVYGNDGSNMSIREYMTRIMNTYNSVIAQFDE